MLRLSIALACLVCASLTSAATAFARQDSVPDNEKKCAAPNAVADGRVCPGTNPAGRDGELDTLYQELREKLTPADAKGLREDQAAWRRERKACGADADCLATVYSDRAAALEQMLENLAFPNRSHTEIDCVPGQVFVKGGCMQMAVLMGEPASEGEMTWSLTRFGDEPGGPTVMLRYGIPETDAVGFEATCGPGGASARTVFWYDIGGKSEGEAVVMDVSSDDYEGQLPGKIYGTELEVGVSGIVLDLDLDAPVWQALQDGSTLSYKAAGGRAEQLQLKGANGPVGKFVADCKAMAASAPQQQAADQPSPVPQMDTPEPADGAGQPEPQAEAQDTGPEVAEQPSPAPQMGAPEPIDAAESPEPEAEPQEPAPQKAGEQAPDDMPAPQSARLSCKRFGTIKSLESKTPVTITFVNKSDGYRSVNWIDFEGVPVQYKGLEQGESFETPTHLTHPWMMTDGPGNCIEMFMPQEGITRFEITVPSPVFGPEDD